MKPMVLSTRFFRQGDPPPKSSEPHTEPPAGTTCSGTPACATVTVTPVRDHLAGPSLPTVTGHESPACCTEIRTPVLSHFGQSHPRSLHDQSHVRLMLHFFSSQPEPPRASCGSSIRANQIVSLPSKRVAAAN